MGANSFPPMGNQDIVEGVKKIVYIINDEDFTSKKDIRKLMDELNEGDSKIYSDKESWEKFLYEDSNTDRSIDVIRDSGDEIELTANGEDLLNGDFYTNFYRLMEREGPHYFRVITQKMDEQIKKGNEVLVGSLVDNFNFFIKEWQAEKGKSKNGNKTAAHIVVNILRDLDVIEKTKEGGEIDAERYSMIKGNPADLLLGRIEDKESNKAPMDEMRRVMKENYGWNYEDFDDALDKLRKEDKIIVRNQSGIDKIILS